METVTIKVGGMTCGGCVASVTRVVQAVPGVERVDVSLDKGQAVVTYDGTKAQPAAFKAVIAAAGFDAA
ncbi:MAG: heavy-metal-associated domain-containing protein [Burkholderiales bacterium]|nr:heavy-metal-associated domain-containing protein [Burkholderiales bacterium]